MEVKNLSIENYKDFINQKDIVLVDLWAPWCGPCRMLGPILEKLCSEDFIQVGKVNVDDDPDIAEAFRVESIPTIILFKEGKLVAKAVGYQPEVAIKNWINKNK
ncbi:MAG: thioredoxin [Acholeplasmatales bacterium]|nr:thioredoxin [Acholeplasmatales bacterium]